MIAKCGDHVIWHWAHRRRVDCDAWWEPETEWHRSWKDRFPLKWQEVVHRDLVTEEKHIADVKTPNGLVIEMQNSPIHPDEVRSREEFYDRMVWVVNGDRRGPDGSSQTLDKSYFHMGRSSRPIPGNPFAFPVEWIGKSKLFHNWSNATADVYFDFGDGILWRLDSFEPDKTVVLEGGNMVEFDGGPQGELFPTADASGRRQRKINLGVVTPVRMVDFVKCCKKGHPVSGGFIPGDLSIFRKELVPVGTVGGRVADGT